LKKLLLVLLICVLVFSLAITAIAKAEKVELVFWAYCYYTDPDKENGWFERRVISEFQEIYPEVEFKLQMLPWTDGPKKVQMAIATGTTPDIIFDCDMRIMSYAAVGALSDFEDTMDAEEQADHYSSVLNGVKFEGKVYMYLTFAIASGFEFNRFVVEEAGAMDLLPLDREDRSWTHEEFKKFCLKVAEANIPDTYVWTFHFADSNCMQHYIKHMHQSFGAVPFVVEDGKYRCVLNSPEAVEGLEWYLDLYNTPGVGMPGAETRDCTYYTDYFYNGQLACTFEGGSAATIMGARKDPAVSSKVDYIIVCNPSKVGEKPITFLSMGGLGVFKSTPEKEKYAKLFAEFFATRPYMWEVTKAHCPPRKSSYDPDSPLYQTSPYPPDDTEINFVLNWAKYMEPVDIGKSCPVYQQYRETYAAVMQGVFVGELTPKEGLDILVERVNKLLDDYYEENPVE